MERGGWFGDRHDAHRSGRDYASARPERETASLALGLALSALGFATLVDLVAAALTGWALTMDPAGSSRPPAELDVAPAVTSMLATAHEISLWSDLALILCVLIGAGAVIRWQTRALRNLPALAVEGPRRSARRAALVWFVPGWGLLATRQTLDELWRSGSPDPRERPDGEPSMARAAARPTTGRPPWVLAAWWVLWIGANLAAVVLVVAVGTSPSTGQLLVAHLGSVVVSGALLGAGVLLRQVLDEITDRQDARYAASTVPSDVR